MDRQRWIRLWDYLPYLLLALIILYGFYHLILGYPAHNRASLGFDRTNWAREGDITLRVEGFKRPKPILIKPAPKPANKKEIPKAQQSHKAKPPAKGNCPIVCGNISGKQPASCPPPLDCHVKETCPCD